MVVTNLRRGLQGTPGAQGEPGDPGEKGEPGDPASGKVSAAGALENSRGAIEKVEQTATGVYKIFFTEAAPFVWVLTANAVTAILICNCEEITNKTSFVRILDKANTPTNSAFSFIAQPV